MATVQEELSPPNSDPALPPPAKARKVENDFFGFMSTPSNQQAPRVKGRKGGRKEIEEYLSEECAAMDSDPLLYWKTHSNKFPIIAKLASCRGSNISSSRKAFQCGRKDISSRKM